MAFLTVLTRTNRRPRALAENQASLKAQTNQDYEQVLLPDEIGRGVAWANAQMRDVGGLIHGRYVMVLDDDDRLTDPALIENLRGIVAVHNPDVIVTRMDHGPRGVLPGLEEWEALPARGRIGCSAVIVRADVWRAHAHHFGAAYDGDYDFIHALLSGGATIYWFDRVVSAVGRIGYGEAEAV